METKKVEMTPEEFKEFQEFKEKNEKLEARKKRADDREAYKSLIDATIESVFPELQNLSKLLGEKKKGVYISFHEAMLMKADLFELKSQQRSHTFTNAAGTMRVILGYYETDGYDDTVNEGIAKVKAFISSLARDPESKMLVDGILRLLSKDTKGNLKASRVIQLKKMAAESNNELFIEGVQIIEDAYRPEVSKSFIRAEYRKEGEAWTNVPLGITEA
ncbi:MAG: DUF3164 family protein [Bacteroidales bacterium]|nr:DUF3164 family protein [Bacteroidales bacterium]